MNKEVDYKIVTIKELLSQGVLLEDVLKICEDIYNMTSFLCQDYPSHKSWFYKKQLLETLDKALKRDIIFAINANLIYGVCCIKDDESEKKICTLFVKEEFRGQGIGTSLVKKAMEILKTTKPVITLNKSKLSMFEGLIKKYEWKQTEQIPGLYNDNSVELIYNSKFKR